MKKPTQPDLTEMSMQALSKAVAQVVEDHQRQRRPLAVWREGKAVWISAKEVGVVREAPIPYRTEPHGTKR